MIRQAIILAAGRGSRLDSFHKSEFSKPLVYLGHQTLLERTIETCRSAGMQRIIVVTGFRSQLVADEVRRCNRGDITLVHNTDWHRSNGLSLYACRPVIETEATADSNTANFLLTMVDHVFDASILSDLANAVLEESSAILATDQKIDSVFDLDDATKVQLSGTSIRRIGKKLTSYDAVDCGVFACTPGIFGALDIAMVGGDASLSDGMSVLAEREKFFSYDIGHRYWQDVDTPEMCRQATKMIRRPEFQPTPTIS